MATLKLQLSKPVRSVKIIGGIEIANAANQTESSPQQQQHDQQLTSLCSALQQTISDFQQFHEELFLSHKEQIVRLSVEIAAKILVKDTRERNYQIENIVAEAIKTIDISGQISIRLNPDDLKTFQQAVESGKVKIPEKALFVDDPVVNPGECIIETDKGVVEYLIAEHLAQVETALLEMETQTEQV